METIERGAYRNMNPVNHLLIGSVIHQIAEKVQPGLLHRAAFLFGNLAPDLAPTQAFRSHRAKYRLDMVRDRLSHTMENAEDCGAMRRAYRLGVLCHYYADFCCYAHSDSYPKNLLRHMRHEHQLSKYSRRRRELLGNLDFIWERLPQEKRELLSSLEAKRQFACAQNAQGINHGVEIYSAIEAGCLLVFSYAAFAGEKDVESLLLPECLMPSVA